MTKLLSSIFLSALLCACGGDNLPVSPDDSRPVAVEVTIAPEAARQITRTTDEDTIADVNVYLLGTTGSQHLYTTTPRLRFECIPGDYTLYIIANVHTNLGAMSEAQLMAYAVTYRDNYADLPMAARTEVHIDAGNGTVTLPPIEVRRQVARIAYNIAVGKSVPDICLRSVCFYNVSRHNRLFGAAPPSNYISCGYADIPEAQAAHYSGVYYLPENCQGTGPSITDQRDKNRDNAPQYATYLLIRATRANRVLDYTVYLGENNTDNFDVRRNTAHTLDITILGDNEVDTRVHGYTLNVWDDLGETTYGGYCTVDPLRGIFVDVEGNTPPIDLWGEVEVTAGDAGCIEFDRASTGGWHEFDVQYPQGRNYYELAYTPELITEDNALLSYTVTVSDEYGYWQTYDFEHHYANEILAYVKYGNAANGEGNVLADEALYSGKIGTTRNLRVLCSENGCSLTAVPDAGYIFAGWYADSKYTVLLSADVTYLFRPASTYTSLYPKFEKDKSSITISTPLDRVTFTSDKGYEVEDIETVIVPYGSVCTVSVEPLPTFTGWYDAWSTTTRKLIATTAAYTFTATEDRTLNPVFLPAENLSAKGTSNCYLVSSPQAAYCFNARVKGNNKATTNITPNILYGSEAKVIWETGTTRGAVIRDVKYSDGQIYFVTGDDYGNALIGLFDNSGDCIWSWHIWFTFYDPATTAQTYTGGRVFMNCNLGAMGNSDPGLYYQWGRKDPFAALRYDMVYHQDYPYDVTDPTMGYGEMTIDYSITHPWAFMCGVLMNDDRYDDAPNWLSPQNPNLWGNPSTAYALAEGGSKSIYDPCPPGWRVPDRKAFHEAAMQKNTSLISDLYYGMRINASGTTAYYPRGGYLMDGTGYNPDKAAYMWTSAPAIYNNGTNYYKHYATALKISPSAVEPLTRVSRDRALPVRCVRE